MDSPILLEFTKNHSPVITQTPKKCFSVGQSYYLEVRDMKDYWY